MKKMRQILSITILTILVVFSSFKANAATFNIDFDPSSAAVELVNLDTDTVVYQKNADVRREPASTTKIMTFIIASEQIKDLDGTKITITKDLMDTLLGTGSSMSNIKIGDQLTALQLMNCMLVPSGNDAALFLADYVGKGSVDSFVDMMNAKAKELGCTGTHFTNPHGLHDENHYTTAHDLYLMTKYAMSLPHFTEITSQARATYKPAGGPDAGKERLLITTNLLIDKNTGSQYYYQYARGIKTGHTDESGYCLVSSATAEGYSYLCVALGAPSIDANGNQIKTRGEMVDTKKLYQWAFKNLQLKSILNSNESIGEVKLKDAWNKDKLLLVAEKNYSAMLPMNVSASSVIITKNIPDVVTAPVKKGQVIGTATLSYANQKLTTVNIVAAVSVERSELLHSANTVKAIFTSVWFIVIVSIIVLLVIIYIILALIYNRKKKNLRRVKKYRKM
nr:D-alanyl-D-alanine carboxypeptidase family protein [uncultured Caproiciproducens sp.]